MNDAVNIQGKQEQSSKHLKENSKKTLSKRKLSEAVSRSAGKDEARELNVRIQELENQLARAVADYRNLEKRIEDTRSETIKFANRELLVRLIPAFDTLFLAEKYVVDKGIKLTIRHLQDALYDVGVMRISTEGATFDASTMEAVTTETGEEGKVLEELRPGYTLNGKLIRPAQVKVGRSAIRD